MRFHYRALYILAAMDVRVIPRYAHLEVAQKELVNIYLKEQTECIQNQIVKIRGSVEDRQSRIAW